MAYDDALFQLGMDLTRSSTAQKEDHGDSARVAPETRKDFFIERDGVRFAGTHLIIDLFGARKLDDLEYIERTLRRCVEVAGATLLDMHLHRSTGKNGSAISGVAVSTQHRIRFHCCPERRTAALDAFVRGEAAYDAVIAIVQEAFSARHVAVRKHARGLRREHRNEALVPVSRAKPRIRTAA